MKTILLADNDKSERSRQKKMLSQLGYATVYEAGSIEQAIDTYKARTPDLVIIRIEPPEKPSSDSDFNGIQVLKALKDINGSALFLMATHSGSDAIVIHAIQGGINEMVVLPLHPDRLKDAIKKLLGQ